MGLIKSNHAPPTLEPFSVRDIEDQARTLLLLARQKADELLSAAQEEAQLLRREAYADALAAGREEGLRQGIEQGRAAGREQALSEQREAIAGVVKALSGAAEWIDAYRQELESQALREVVELALAVARRVAKRQGLLDPGVLEQNLVEAMKLVTHAADVRVAVHPSQRGTLDELLPRLRMEWPRLQHLEVVQDESLSPGGCRVFTEHGQIDADLDAQLDRIVVDLLPSPSERES